MNVRIRSRFAFHLPKATDVLLQFEAADLPEQALIDVDTRISGPADHSRVPAQDSIGERTWLNGEGRVEVEYSALVRPQRKIAKIEELAKVAPHDLPGETAQYLFDSRYCAADQFQPFVDQTFADSAGGARIAAIRDWIGAHFSYEPGVSNARTSATDSFIERRGVCRDFTHVLITLARASGIPARYVSCYAPDVSPPDFHALAEVFLADPDRERGGTWQMVDATGMADPSRTAKIGVGRDAADVSFLTSFGPNRFEHSQVEVTCED